MNRNFAALIAILLMATSVHDAQAANVPEANYDESKVGNYPLPDPLVDAKGQPVKDAKTWRDVQRPRLLELFRTEEYGRSPGKPPSLRFEVLETGEHDFGGVAATRKQVLVHFSDKPGAPTMEILLYLPQHAAGPVPVFLGMNFGGNQAVTDDPEVHITKSWLRTDPEHGVVDNHATEKSRASESSRWSIDLLLKRGYGLATVYYGDVDPDFDDGFQNGVHPLFYKEGQKRPKPDEWGSIAAWAWGLSRALDYLETDHDVDAKHVAVIGHSRLGKTSLWAGAEDERFALVVSNDSGCGGAALSRRDFGETVWRINTAFPHWFCENYKTYNEHPEKQPVDQHELIALIAPRPVYVASAVDDKWADPHGEFLSCVGADPVYKLLGKPGLGTKEMPAVDHPVGGTIGYHVRTGGHDVMRYDWEQYINFADRHFGRTAQK